MGVDPCPPSPGHETPARSEPRAGAASLCEEGVDLLDFQVLEGPVEAVAHNLAQLPDLLVHVPGGDHEGLLAVAEPGFVQLRDARLLQEVRRQGGRVVPGRRIMMRRVWIFSYFEASRSK